MAPRKSARRRPVRGKRTAGGGDVAARLEEALAREAATSEILRVISQSPTATPAVFDAIAASATRLCHGLYGLVFRFDGELISLAAEYGSARERMDVVRSAYPRPPGRGSVAAQAILERRVIAIADAQNGTEYPHLAERARAIGYHSILSVPMLLRDTAIGAINVVREEAVPFTDAQIALLKTFADQAVIAIENVRLFKELEARNRDLTATSEILRVISISPTDVQPVFDRIAQSAARLCEAFDAAIFERDGDRLRLVAHHGPLPDRPDLVIPVIRGTVTGRCVLDRKTVSVADLQAAEDDFPQGVAFAREFGFRSFVSVPLLRESVAIGAIGVRRTEVQPFTDTQITLLQTFADQAVIAIENVRLFRELRARTDELTRSVAQLTALGEVGRAVSSTLDIDAVLDTIVLRASELAGGAGCSIYEYDEGAERFELRATHHYDPELVEALRALPLRRGEGLMGRAAETHEPAQTPDITRPGVYQSSLRDTLIQFGYRALLSVPLLRENHVIGSLSFSRKTPGEFSPDVVAVLKTFATQSALAIQNARLFREIAEKSRQLEIASQHKSEFLANMSHELRTPLNAVIGFSEVLAERMFGDLNDKQDEYLRDIHASGQHLLSLINDILDLSKIEAGRMELEPAEFDLPSIIDTALILVRERAGRRGIALERSVDDRAGVMRADERKVKQVLLNLLSNAIKFTPEGGRVEVRASIKDDVAEISVIDTGIGIAPEDQEAVFEEFRQVGASAKRIEGTGLGLALSRKFVELHGGRISVTSRVGEGSTFTFSIPCHMP